MGLGTIVFLVALIAAVLYGTVIYNALVAVKHAVAQSWANIDVLLKQRNDELPKLVAVAREYMGYEQETLERVTQARNRAEVAQRQGNMGALGAAENEIRLGLGNFFAVAEAYPELRANEAFNRLARRISGLENAIADRREFYNAAVNRNNVRIAQIPDVVVARLFGFTAFELLQFEPSDLRDVDVAALFRG
ncbi:LemA family protein [Thioalkalivibrio paradoxus]|uniref:LemA family protein n=1 Tax=Thioalkalivibrio paradoxus ARh 1 TaxID=713585 RepID=W0DE64_9GAMM|nr:LemA family protein [Thioalkalivibrio paradoxus]AHE96924.1 LemA family protein [Thioalkalivibrio paradoxus ARh 1]